MTKNRTALLQIGLVAVFLLPLLAHMLNGQFARMVSDDFCFSETAIKQGWWGAMVYQYANWSGTYSSTGVQAGVALLGATALRWLPMILLTTWLVGSIWTVYELALRAGIVAPRFTALFLGSLVVFVTLEGIPNVFQALYWRSGSATYITPLALMSLGAGYLLYLIRRPPHGAKFLLSVVVIGILALIIGGFSPVVAPLQVGLLGLALIGCWRFVPLEARRTVMMVLGVGVACAIVALVILVIAPGNSIRQAKFSPPDTLLGVGLLSLQFAASFVAIQVGVMSPLPLLIVLGVGGTFGWRERARKQQDSPGMKWVGKWLLLVSVVGIFLFLAELAPSAYGTGLMIPARAFVVPQFVLIIMAFAWGYIMGWGAKINEQHTRILGYIGVVLFVGLLLIGPVRSTLTTLALTDDFHAFATEWDERDHFIQTQVTNGVTELRVPAFSVDLADYIGTSTPDANNGSYVCARNYYGLTSLGVMPS